MNSSARLQHHLCFLDVGHGNSTVLLAGDESVVVVDVGRQSALSEFLREQGIKHINSVYLSHADADHIGGLTGILATKEVSIDHVFLNSDALRDTKIWNDLLYELDRAREAGSLEPVIGLVAGRTEELAGEVRLQVLGPSVYLAGRGAGSTDRQGEMIQTNSISAVISISVAGATLALLPADLDGVGLRDLLRHDADIRASILVFPHHGAGAGGSTDSVSYARTLLNAVNPELVVFSIGRGLYSTPNPEILRAVREVAPDARIVCTQLSEHCAKELPDEPATHLSQAFARGRERNALLRWHGRDSLGRRGGCSSEARPPRRIHRHPRTDSAVFSSGCGARLSGEQRRENFPSTLTRLHRDILQHRSHPFVPQQMFSSDDIIGLLSAYD